MGKIPIQRELNQGIGNEKERNKQTSSKNNSSKTLPRQIYRTRPTKPTHHAIMACKKLNY